MKFFIIAIVIFVTFKIIILLGLFRAILTLRLKKGSCKICNPKEVPLYLLKLFEPWGNKLKELGFYLCAYEVVDDFTANEYSKRIAAIYFDSKTMCFASIVASVLPEKNSPVKIETTSYFTDGHTLTTLNNSAHDVLLNIPDTTLIDPYSETIEGQYTAHIEALNKLKQQRQIKTMTAEGHAEIENIRMSNYFDSLIAARCIKQENENYYRMKFIPAIKYIFKYIKGSGKVKKSSQKGMTVDVPIEAESEAFLRIQDNAKHKPGILGNLAVFAVSMIIFIFAFKVGFSFESVLILGGVIIFHELGHYISMRLFNYNDVHIMFMPFGAATFGTNTKATVTQRVVIYLMGPAPGLIIGTCLMLMAKDTGSGLHKLGLFMQILNCINLIPVVPLDGGRVFELALFSKIPSFKTAFSVLSIVILLGAAIYSSDPFLIVFSLILISGTYAGFQQNRVLAELKLKIKNENIERQEKTLVPIIFSMLKRKQFANKAFKQKIQTVKFLLENITSELPTAGTTAIALGLYFLVCLLPFFILFNWTIVRILIAAISK
jgi:Zn-dependent protease